MISITRAKQLRELIVKAAISLSDEDALEGIELFPAWESGKAYAVGDRIRYIDTLYKCVQAHTSQDDWTPDITPALWTEVSIDEWPEWKQPQGAHNAYRIGAKVSHNDKHWINEMDYNIYEPGVAGWIEAQE